MWRKRRAQYWPPRELWCHSEDCIRSLVLCVRRAIVLSLLCWLISCFFSCIVQYVMVTGIANHFDPKRVYRCLEVFGFYQSLLGNIPAFSIQREDISPQLAVVKKDLAVSQFDLFQDLDLLCIFFKCNIALWPLCWAISHIYSDQVKCVCVFFCFFFPVVTLKSKNVWR